MRTKQASVLGRIKEFGMTNQMIATDLARVERLFGLDLGHLPQATDTEEETYYPQFAARVRAEAHRMARHYELFYCLERTVRDLVNQALTEAKQTDDWWNSDCVPQHIRAEVAGRIKNEIDSGVSRRSEDELDFTTFGELGTIITSNWDTFGSIFSSKKAVEKVVGSLNSLRNPIAHCCPLAEDEELRLRLALRDWFRLME